MTTAAETPESTKRAPSPQTRSSRASRTKRFAENCTPLPAVPGETMDQRVERLDASLTYLSQCYQDELDVRDEGNLLVDIITQVLIPFAAISAAISLLYVRVTQWAATNFPSFERIAALSYLVVLALVLILLFFARTSGRISWVNATIDRTEDRFHSSVPTRKETLTRNNLVNQWIYVWIVGAILIFIPVTFIVLRSGVGNDLGMRLAIDTAGVCEGSGRIRIFTGSDTCVQIQEDHAPKLNDTSGDPSLADTASSELSSVEFAATPGDAQAAEIRLDATTTLSLAMLVLVFGILANMALWWWRNRGVRDIEVM